MSSAVVGLRRRGWWWSRLFIEIRNAVAVLVNDPIVDTVGIVQRGPPSALRGLVNVLLVAGLVSRIGIDDVRQGTDRRGRRPWITARTHHGVEQCSGAGAIKD